MIKFPNTIQKSSTTQNTNKSNNPDEPKEEPGFFATVNDGEDHFSPLPKELKLDILSMLNLEDVKKISETSTANKASVDLHFETKLAHKFGINFKEIDKSLNQENEIPIKFRWRKDLIIKFRSAKELFSSLIKEFNNKYEQADFKFVLQIILQKKGKDICSLEDIKETSELLLHTYKYQGRDRIAGLFKLGFCEVDLLSEKILSRKKISLSSEIRCIKNLFFEQGMSLEEAKLIINELDVKQQIGIAAGLTLKEVENFSQLESTATAYEVANVLVQYRGELTVDDFRGIEFDYIQRVQMQHLIKKNEGMHPKRALQFIIE